MEDLLCKSFCSVLFSKQVPVMSLPFGLLPLIPLAIESQVCQRKEVLQLTEALFCFYFGGLKLITDCGLCLYVQSEMGSLSQLL
jgi:hypothetical protein